MVWISNVISFLEKERLIENTIIVDNYSIDGFRDWIIGKLPSANIFLLSENMGFGAANNRGIEIVVRRDAEYILLLNQDAWLLPGSLDIMLDLFKMNENLGIVSPLHLNSNLKSFDSNFKNCFSVGDFTSYFLRKKLGLNNEFISLPFVNAAIWLLSVDCLKNVGGFNPSFYHYGEDNEFCDRLISRGYKIFIQPHALGVHDRENRDFEFNLNRERLGCLNFLKIYYFKDTSLVTLLKIAWLAFINTSNFRLNIFQRVGVFCSFILDLKSLKTNKYLANNEIKPFINFDETSF